jgi:hypothetical protein
VAGGKGGTLTAGVEEFGTLDGKMSLAVGAGLVWRSGTLTLGAGVAWGGSGGTLTLGSGTACARRSIAVAAAPGSGFSGAALVVG